MSADRLNGGEFVPFDDRHWKLIAPLLEENERLLGIPLDWILSLDGQRRAPEDIYRMILPARLKALQPEEAWVAESNHLTNAR